MKSIIKNASGVLLKEYDKPEIKNDQDVLLRILTAGLCRTDLYAAQGKIPVKMPVILGHEFSATVEAVGSAVQYLKKGHFVSVMPVFEENAKWSMLGVDRDGAFCEFIVVPETYVYKVPTCLTEEEAAFLEPVAACLSVTKAPIYPDQRGLIYGDNRIAELTFRILQVKGFQNLEIKQPKPTELLPENTYDFVIETLATPEIFRQIVQMLKPKGVFILKSRPFLSIEMPVTQIVQKELSLYGTHYGNFQEGIYLLAAGKVPVKDLLGDTYSFEEALEILEGRREISEMKKIFFRP